MNQIDHLISEVKFAREIFAPKPPELTINRFHEYLYACDILLLLLQQPKPDVNLIAYFAGKVAKDFREAHPKLLPDTAKEILNWARTQNDIIFYERSHSFLLFNWTTKEP